MVNEKLIRKYINGGCTLEEKKQVEAWLHNTTVPKEDDYVKEFAASKDRIWNEIRQDIPQKQPKTISFYKTLNRYSAAAFLAAGLFVSGYYLSESDSDNSLLAQETGSIEYKTTPKSRIVQFADDKGDKSLIQFEGELLIKNQSGRNKQMTVQLADSKTSPYKTRKITIKNNEQYVAFHLNFKQYDEVLVYNLHHQSSELSPRLYHKIQQIKGSI